MIIGLDDKHKLGEIIVGDYYETHTKIHKGVRIFLRRAATYEEWLEYRRGLGLPTGFDGEADGFFYEVSTD